MMATNDDVSMIKKLPAEILERIFRFLPPPKLKAVMQVCRRWREVGEAPSLWTWVSLAPVTELSLPSAANMLRSKRLSLATCLEARVVSRELLEAIGDHPGLRGLDIGYSTCSLETIPAPLIVHALTSGLQSVDMRKTGLNLDQVEVLFKALVKGVQLKSLNLSWITSISYLEPELVSNVATLLERIDLGFIQMTRAQTLALFEALKQGTSPLKRLNLSQSDLAHIDPSLLAEVVIDLEEVGLENTKLQNPQVKALCQMLEKCSRKLKSLELGANNLSLSGSLVGPALFARAMTQLEGVGLSGTRLTNQQLKELLNFLAADSCKVQYLSLEKNNLSDINEDLLTTAVTRLTTADLRWANLSCHQVTSILTGSLVGTTLQELQLGMIWGEVEDSLLTRARAVIPQLELEMMKVEPMLPGWDSAPEETDWFSDSD